MTQEIKIDGLAIAPAVLSSIVSGAAEEVEGIASVGPHDLASNLVSMLSSRNATSSVPEVEAVVEDGSLHITVRLTVFFGYPFKKLADNVRVAVVKAIDAQVGVPVSAVDVCIDGLVFPKE